MFSIHHKYYNVTFIFVFFLFLSIIFLITRMITCQEKALDEMRRGLFDVLPSGSLDALTAEDFRLLLNGVSNDINPLQNF